MDCAAESDSCSTQIDVAVNAPGAGTIKEFLAKEEDTVAVDQELVKLELGGAPEGKKEQPAEKPAEKPEAKPEEKPAEKPKEPAAEPKAPEPEKPSPPPSGQQQPPKEAAPQKPQPAAAKPEPAAQPAPGSREERRVRLLLLYSLGSLLITVSYR